MNHSPSITAQNQLDADSLTQYEAVRANGAGIIDLSSRGRITVSGSEAVMFLNGLITNDMKTLSELHWMPAVFPNVQGRLVAAVRVMRLPDETTPVFLLDTEAATHQTVRKIIDRFTLAGDFRVTDITSTTAMFSVQGNDARQIADKVFDDVSSKLTPSSVVRREWKTKPVTLIEASHTGADGFDVTVDREDASALLNSLVSAGASVVGPIAFEALRIEAGVPRYGVDMDETNVVSETNLDDAVSFTKGCYVGQEIIARIKYRGHVAKKLTGIVFDGKEEIETGAVIKSVEGKGIGRITSTVFSPHLQRTIALGYLRYEHLAAGTDVVVGDSAFHGKVTDLPFVRS